MPFGAAYTYKIHIRDYPPPLPLHDPRVTDMQDVEDIWTQWDRPCDSLLWIPKPNFFVYPARRRKI